MELDVSSVAGSATDDIKSAVWDCIEMNTRPGSAFGAEIANTFTLEEVSISPKAEEPAKKEAKVVIGCIVSEQMLNVGHNVHGGCSAFLVDICSTLALLAYNMAMTGEPHMGVTLSLNMVYHSPAQLGDKLRIVNWSKTVGGKASSARTEIWNATHHRLVASGVHIKMMPSFPKNKL